MTPFTFSTIYVTGSLFHAVERKIVIPPVTCTVKGASVEPPLHSPADICSNATMEHPPRSAKGALRR